MSVIRFLCMMLFLRNRFWFMFCLFCDLGKEVFCFFFVLDLKLRAIVKRGGDNCYYRGVRVVKN